MDKVSDPSTAIVCERGNAGGGNHCRALIEDPHCDCEQALDYDDWQATARNCEHPKIPGSTPGADFISL